MKEKYLVRTVGTDKEWQAWVDFEGARLPYGFEDVEAASPFGDWEAIYLIVTN